MKSIRKPAIIIVCSLAILGVQNLYAQNDEAQQGGGKELTLEEIIVTAMRREQSLQDIPATINAFSGTDLENMRFQEIDDIAMFIPNVDVKTTLGGQNSVITIRGVGLNDYSSNNTGSVGVYVDDIFLASVISLEFNTFDMERLEALKGPQGTLYGRNATAGAINIISRKPSEEKGGYFTIGAGNYDFFESEGAITGPVSDKFSYRLSGRVGYQGESYYTSLATGDDFGDRTAYAVRGQLAYSGDTWDTNVKLQYSNDEGPSVPSKVFGVLTPESSVLAREIADFLGFPALAPVLATPPEVGLGGVGEFCGPILAGIIDPFACADTTGYQDLDPDVRSSAANFAGGNFAELDSFDFTLSAINNFSDTTTFTSITGYRKVERSFGEDTDSQPLTIWEYQHNTDVEQLSQEFRFNIVTDKANWVAGVFASYDQIDVSNPVLTDDFFLTRLLISVDQETTSYAGFANVIYEMSDTFSVSGGLRLTYEDKSYIGGTTDLNPWGISLLLMDPDTGEFYPDALPISFIDTDFSETDLSGHIGFEYRPSDTMLFYGSISKGFKSGGVIGDITFSDEELQPFEPEVLWSYEAGIKTSPADNLKFNASVFYYDYQNVQTFVEGSLGPVLGNVEKAKVLGADIEMVWLPVTGLTLQGGLGLLDTELGEPYKGNKLPNAAPVSATLLTSYELPVTDSHQMVIAADIKYSDEMERDAANDPLTTTGSYTVVNARLAWEPVDIGWTVSLWAKNLFDEEFTQQSYSLPTLGIVNKYYNAPRTFGISATRQF